MASNRMALHFHGGPLLVIYKLNNGIASAEGYLHGFYFLKWSNYYGLSISELIFSKQSFSAFYFYGRLFYDFSIVKNW